MGLQRRRKSGNIFGGSKLNVDGQGIYTVKISPNDPIPIKSKFTRVPRVPIPTPTLTPTPTVTSTPTSTPTPTPTPSTNCLFLASENLDNLMTENNDYLILYCP